MNGRLRIAYLTGLYAWGGDTFVRDEVAELRALGHEVHTFAIRRPQQSERQIPDVRAEFERTTYVLHAGGFALARAVARVAIRNPYRIAAAARIAVRTGWPGIRGRLWPLAYLVEACYVAERMREARIEHLHNHIGEGAASVAMLASALTGIPFSITFHGPTIFDRPRQLALNEKMDRVAFAVAISWFTRSQLGRWMTQENWDKVKVVRCGVRAAFLERAVEPVPDAPKLISVGRLVPEKGHSVLVQAVAEVVASGYRVELVIVGAGDQRDQLVSLVTRLGLHDSVRFVGWLPPEAVADELLRARALVLPSFAEGLPITVMESFALRRPVIATSVGGIPELVREGENGWLVPASSTQALAGAIRKVLDTSPCDLLRMGESGAHVVATYHDASRQARHLAALMTGEARCDNDRGTDREISAKSEDPARLGRQTEIDGV